MNTRNLEDVVRSTWWARTPTPADISRRVERGRLTEADSLGDVACRLHYNYWTTDRGLLRGMFDWLGEEYDAGRVSAVLDVPHSY